MTKHLLAALALAASTTLTLAQDEVLKPTTGAKNLEVQINPFTSNPLGLINGFKFRYFQSPTNVLRVSANLNYAYTNKITQDAGTGNSNQKELHDRSSSFEFTIRPGIERHLPGTRRISPYYGGEVLLGIVLTGRKQEEQDLKSSSDVQTTTYTNESGGFRVGVAGVVGADVYLIQNLYLGAEMGFGLTAFNPFATKVTPPQGDSFTSNVGKSTTFSAAPFILPAFRVGFIF